MEYDDLLKDMKKSRKEKEFFSNLTAKIWTDKEFADKANAYVEAAENLIEAERELLGNVGGVADRNTQPDTTSLEDDENDPIFTPRKRKQEIPEVPAVVQKSLPDSDKARELLRNVDVEKLLTLLREEVRKRTENGSWGKQDTRQWKVSSRKFWRKVHDYLEGESAMDTEPDSKGMRRNKQWAPFVRYIVAPCQPELVDEKYNNSVTNTANALREMKVPFSLDDIDELLAPAFS